MPQIGQFHEAVCVQCKCQIETQNHILTYCKSDNWKESIFNDITSFEGNDQANHTMLIIRSKGLEC